MDQADILSCIARIHAYGQPRSFSKPYRTTDRSKGVGTGAFIDPPVPVDGFIFVLTCAHVVDGADSLTVILPLLGQEELPASTLCFIPQDVYDLAIVAIEDPRGEYRVQTRRLPLGDSDTLKPGEQLTAYGFPLGQTGLKVSDGVYSGFQHLLQHTVSISPGNSGGPLVNSQHQIVGINNSGIVSPGASNIGYAVPISFYKSTCDALFQRTPGEPSPGRVLRLPSFGLYYQPSTTALIQEAGASDSRCSSGVYIYKILPDSPLARAGVDVGDILTGFDGLDIDNRGEVRVPWNSQKVELQYVLQRVVDSGHEHAFHIWSARRKQCVVLHIAPQNLQVNGMKMNYPPQDPMDYIAFMGMCLMDLCKNHRTQTATFKSYIKLEPEELAQPHIIITHIFNGMKLSVTGALSTGQIITHINGRPVSSMAEAREAFKRPVHGNLLSVVTKDGPRFTVSVEDALKEESDFKRGTRVYEQEEDIIAALQPIVATAPPMPPHTTVWR